MPDITYRRDRVRITYIMGQGMSGYENLAWAHMDLTVMPEYSFAQQCEGIMRNGVIPDWPIPDSYCIPPAAIIRISKISTEEKDGA